MLRIRRRGFITFLGGAAAWPLAARAQRALPLIGYLGINSREGQASFVAGFRKGLGETGFVEGRNVAIEYRWADGQFERMPGLISDLIRNRVTVIFASAPSAVRAAQAQTATIPIVFHMGEDPIKEGVVASLNRPGANVTGVSDFANQLAGKRLALLRDTVPKGAVYALLVRPSHPNVESDTKDAQVAAYALGLDLRVLMADDEHQIDMAFNTMAQLRIGALFVNIDPFFIDRREQIAALAARHAIPAIYPLREFATAGGLMSYGADRIESSRQTGIYVGRILKGESPADLPVMQATKFELVINLGTAKTLGLTIPPGIFAIADEVIE
jgi:putative ABC transport system substrate-binding protein